MGSLIINMWGVQKTTMMLLCTPSESLFTAFSPDPVHVESEVTAPTASLGGASLVGAYRAIIKPVARLISACLINRTLLEEMFQFQTGLFQSAQLLEGLLEEHRHEVELLRETEKKVQQSFGLLSSPC